MQCLYKFFHKNQERSDEVQCSFRKVFIHKVFLYLIFYEQISSVNMELLLMRKITADLEGTVMQIEKALINDHLRVSKVS